MRGKRPKPTAVRELEGNRGHRRQNRSEAQFAPARVEDCPAWLNAVARAEWFRLAPQMIGLGLLSAADIVAFAGYCAAYSHVVACEARIARGGTADAVLSDGEPAGADPGQSAADGSEPDLAATGPAGKRAKGKKGQQDAAAPAGPDKVTPFPVFGGGKRGKRGQQQDPLAGLTGGAEFIDAVIDAVTSSDGMTMLDKHGTLRLSPYVSAETRWLDKVRQFASEFGLTPSARGRIELETLGDAADAPGMLSGDAGADQSEDALLAEKYEIERQLAEIGRLERRASRPRGKAGAAEPPSIQ